MNAVLNQLSDALRAHSSVAQSMVVTIRNAEGRHLAGTLWQDNIVITSEQAMGTRESYSIICGDQSTTARIFGRDQGTNILALRTDDLLKADRRVATEPSVGALVMAFGATATGSVTARLGLVNTMGPQWHSRAGGRIDARIALDIRLARTEEGGPVFDMQGAVLGMSTLGVAGEVLVIPAATIERVLPQLLSEGHVSRGWIGLALHAVAVPDALRDAAGDTHGMMVMSTAAAGPGAKAGVMAGDIALSLDGTPLHRMRQLAAHLDSESIGKQVELRVIRGGEIVALKVEISPRPAK